MRIVGKSRGENPLYEQLQWCHPRDVALQNGLLQEKRVSVSLVFFQNVLQYGQSSFMVAVAESMHEGSAALAVLRAQLQE